MRRGRLKVFLIHMALISVVFTVASPVLVAFFKSTQTRDQVFSYPPVLGFGSVKAMLDNYGRAWNQYRIGIYMKNSMIVSVAVTVAKTLLSMLAGLAIVYFDFPLKAPIFYFILFTLMMPTEIMIIALFNLVSKLGLGNTYAALIFPFMASATGVFLFRQHFSSIPPDLADAARVDGAGPLRFLWNVLLPLSWNVIGAFALIQFIYMWNQYLWPLVIIRESSRQVIQVGLKSTMTAMEATDWGLVMAAVILAMIPPLIVFALLQEQFTKGFVLAREK